MDSLEKIFSEKFEFMPYVKFGLPDDISRGSLNWYLGAYRSKKKTIYLASAINHLIAVQLGTTDRNEAGRENAATFKKVTVHELGHMMHDMFLQRLTKKRLDFDYFDDGFQTTAIEYEVVSEGIADWIEARYSKKEYKYDPPEHFPNSVPEWHQEIWRQYGISFVGPILDIDPQKGLEYLVLHPFKIDKEFRASAKAYQIEAISALTSKSESR
jgi:hypothetical protein